MGNKIVHFEIPAADVDKMSKFYSDLFGWKFDKQSMPGMDYWMIATGGQSDLAGGMYKKMDESEKPRFYVQVDNIDDHTNRFKSAGGMVIVEKQEIPGMGWSVIGTDPEGNHLGLFQGMMRQQTAPPPTKKTLSSKSKGKSAGKKSSTKKKKGRK